MFPSLAPRITRKNMKSLDRQRLKFKGSPHSLIALAGILLYLAAFSEICWSAPSPANLCYTWIQKTETRHQLPQHLLAAIARIESGRLNKTKKKVEPWPWTINVNGQGYFFASKEAALKAIQRFQARGIKNIDVGCMQVNWAHHGHAFSSIAQALEPAQNVAYAARFLKRLKQAHTSWDKAVAHYHSATPFYHIPYHQKVYRAWLHEQGNSSSKPFDNRKLLKPFTGLLSPSLSGLLSRTRGLPVGKGVRRQFLMKAATLHNDPVRLRHIRSYKENAAHPSGVRILRGTGYKAS
jgi:hypothetical protein